MSPEQICPLSAIKVKAPTVRRRISHAGDGGMPLAARGNNGARCGVPPSMPIQVPFDFKPVPLNLISAAENKQVGRAFDQTHCRYEVRFMSSLALREDIRPAAEASAISISAGAASPSKPANASIEGVLLFAGIGFGLMVLAAIFGYLELPPPYF
jgi:hypothetical protein